MSAILLSSHVPHAAHAHGFSQAQSRLCSDAGHPGGKSKIDLCCDACQIGGAPGLGPIHQSSFLFRHEISTRLTFAQRLGHVADATPDNLRSRAPPALSA